MKVEYTASARSEYIEAAEFYSAQKPELGDEFCEEIQRTIKRIIEYPEAWTQISQFTRRCRTRRFPYGVLYQIKSDVLLIIGVMHLSRSPHTWKDRLPPQNRG